MAAPFFTQAHITQFTEVGWRFIPGASGSSGCNGTTNAAGIPNCDLTWASLVSPDLTQFSLIAVSSSDRARTLNVSLGRSFEQFQGVDLQHFVTTEDSYFVKQSPVAVPATGDQILTLHLAAFSVTTISNRAQQVG